MTAPLLDPQLEAFNEAAGSTQLPDPEEHHDRVALEVAAAVIVGTALVRKALEAGGVEDDPSGAAKRLWDQHAPLWLRAVVPAIKHAYQLGLTEGLTPAEIDALAQGYASTLGDYVSETSADALADGINRQIADGWNERVAWKRASSGYGLDKREMRSYVGGLMLGSKNGRTDVVPDTARMLVDRAVLARADRIGRSESWTATQSGQALAWMFMYKAGRLPVGSQREWDTAEDEATCSICAPLDGVRVDLDQPFVLLDDRKIWGPQAHPGCRCKVKLIVPPEEIEKRDDPIAAGVCLRAADTGRVLMLQRALSDDDPASGTWEFPGGHLEGDEQPIVGAVREWEEEVHRRLPGDAKPIGQWRSGCYAGFVMEIPTEAAIPTHRRGRVVNPDDPDGDEIEAFAWWEPDQLRRNPAVRKELAAGLPALRRALDGWHMNILMDHDEVTKAYDPRESRDQTGRWTAVAERGMDEETAELIRQALVKPDPLRPSQALRALQPATSPLRQANPLRTSSALQPAADTLALRPAVESVESVEPQRTVRNHVVVFPSVKRPEGAADAKHDAFYLPVDDIANYFYDAGRQSPSRDVNFSAIRRYFADVHNNHNPVQAQPRISAWDVAPEMYVDDHSWDLLAPQAVGLYHEALKHPEHVLGQLSDVDVAAIFERAGYGKVLNARMDDALDMLEDNIHDPDAADTSLREAYADHMTWLRPDLLGEGGEQFEHDLNARIGIAAIEEHPVPGVFVFEQGFTNSGPDDLHGTYDIEHVGYRSAIAEFGEGIPPGMFGVREYHLKPAADDPE